MEIPPACVRRGSSPAASSTRSGVCVCVRVCVPALRAPRPQAGEGTLNQNLSLVQGPFPSVPREALRGAAGGPRLRGDRCFSNSWRGTNLFFATARREPIRADPTGALVLGEENTRRANPGVLILAGTFQLPAGQSPDSQEGGQDLGLLPASPHHCPLLTPTQTQGWFQRASGRTLPFPPRHPSRECPPASRSPAGPVLPQQPGPGAHLLGPLLLLGAVGPPLRAPAPGLPVRFPVSGLAFRPHGSGVPWHRGQGPRSWSEKLRQCGSPGIVVGGGGLRTLPHTPPGRPAGPGGGGLLLSDRTAPLTSATPSGPLRPPPPATSSARLPAWPPPPLLVPGTLPAASHPCAGPCGPRGPAFQPLSPCMSRMAWPCPRAVVPGTGSRKSEERAPAVGGRARPSLAPGVPGQVGPGRVVLGPRVGCCHHTCPRVPHPQHLPTQS